jgi:hypothetical protein
VAYFDERDGTGFLKGSEREDTALHQMVKASLSRKDRALRQSTE